MPDIPIKSNAVVVYVLRKGARGHEVLLLKRSKRDALDKLWLPVAGGIEEGETAQQTALRELQEETGLHPRALYAANFCEQFYNSVDHIICILPVFVALVEENDEVIINHEHSAFGWFTMEEAYKAVSMHNQRECLDMVQRSFIDNTPHSIGLIKEAA